MDKKQLELVYKIGDWYLTAPETTPDYSDFIAELNRQFWQIPVKMELTKSDLLETVATFAGWLKYVQNKGLLVTSTLHPDFMPPIGPLSVESPYFGWLQNDILRAVHDYYGRYLPGNNFDTIGEIRANWAHGRMFSEKARRALYTEQLAQTCAVHLLNPNVYPCVENLANLKFAEQRSHNMPNHIFSLCEKLCFLTITTKHYEY